MKPTDEDLYAALESVCSAIAFSPGDYSVYHRDAWIYQVLLGWDDAFDEVADMHRWTKDTRCRAIQLHAAVKKFLNAHGKQAAKEKP